LRTLGVRQWQLVNPNWSVHTTPATLTGPLDRHWPALLQANARAGAAELARQLGVVRTNMPVVLARRIDRTA
jgi:hypothetical protein